MSLSRGPLPRSTIGVRVAPFGYLFLADLMGLLTADELPDVLSFHYRFFATDLLCTRHGIGNEVKGACFFLEPVIRWEIDPPDVPSLRKLQVHPCRSTRPLSIGAYQRPSPPRDPAHNGVLAVYLNAAGKYCRKRYLQQSCI